MVAVKRRRKAAIVESDSVCHGCKERGNFTQSTSRAKKTTTTSEHSRNVVKRHMLQQHSLSAICTLAGIGFFAATSNAAAAAANAVIIAALHALATGRGGSSVCVRNSGGGVAIDVKRLRGISGGVLCCTGRRRVRLACLCKRSTLYS